MKAWVVGCNGLLGSALVRGLNRQGVNVFKPPGDFCWDDERRLYSQLQEAVKLFAKFNGNGNNWQIFWAAGVGTMSSPEADLQAETRSLSELLKLIETEPGMRLAKGCFSFASSAGAIYASTSDEITSENTPIAPTTAYANEKLKQESLISAFASNNAGVTALLARISTLYGPGQATGKQQGLLAHMARSILRNQSINIYVPFDTIRDYITVDDATSAIITTLRVIDNKPGVFIKIIASETPTTIAEIVSTFKKVSRRQPRIVASTNQLSQIYSQRVQFRSTVIPINELRSKTSLLIGVAQVLAAERSAFSRSYRCGTARHDRNLQACNSVTT